MALNGDSGWLAFGPYSSYSLRVVWSAKQNIGGNFSDVTVNYYMRSNNSSSWFDYTSNAGLQINGTSYDRIGERIILNANTTITLKTQTARINHGPDGSKSIDIFFNFTNPVTGTSPTFKTTADFTKIPRAYDFNVARTSVDMDSAVTMLIVNNGSGYSAKVYIDFGNKRVTMNASPPIGSNFNITPKISDFADQIPNNTYGVGNYVVETWNGGTKIGSSSKQIQLNLPSSITPTVSSVTYADQNATVKSVTGSDQILVQGKSIPQMSVVASSVYGATIKAWTFEWGGQSYTNNGPKYNIDLSQTPTLNGNQTVKVTVTDTRGRTTTMNDTLDIRAYAPPKITKLTADRLADPTTTISLVKTVSVASIKNGTTEKNSYTVVTRYKKSTETAWTTAKTETNTSANFTMTGFAVDSSYDIDVTVTDQFGSYASKVTVSTITTLMDFYRDVGVGVGKIYESGHGALDVGGMIYMLNTSLLDLAHPIGSSLITTDSRNPSTYLPGAKGTTWIQDMQGYVPVGVDPSDSDFDTVGKTGGEKTHTLTVAEMPSHNHIPSKGDYLLARTASDAQGLTQSPASKVGLSGTANTGGDQSHNNLQPFKTKYIWTRTA